MNIEHIASSSSSCFYKRLVRVLTHKKNVIDVKYSTTALKTENEDDEPVQYSALILYEDKKESI